MGNERALINDWAAHLRGRHLSQRTVGRYSWSLCQWVDYLREHERSLASASIDDVEAFLRRFHAPQSRRSVGSDLRQFYRWALERGRLGNDPTKLLHRVKVPRRAPSPVAVADVRRLIAAASHRDRLVVMLAAYAGLRVTEIADLRGEDVDLEGRALVVRNGKGGKDARLPLAAELVAELERWPRRGFLVGLASGGAVGQRVRNLMRSLGIDHRPHDLRHSFGTQVAHRCGGNLLEVAPLMRHDDIATTVRYVDWETHGHDIVSGLYDDGPRAA